MVIKVYAEWIDAEYGKLKEFLGNELVHQPATMPWGNRSMLFRDPDGNLVNFFAPVIGNPRREIAF